MSILVEFLEDAALVVGISGPIAAGGILIGLVYFTDEGKKARQEAREARVRERMKSLEL